MKITIKEVLLSIGKNASKTSESVKLDTNKVCKKITSMYQDIDPETIFKECNLLYATSLRNEASIYNYRCTLV